MSSSPPRFFLLILIFCSAALAASAQGPEEQEAVRVAVEEVRVAVAAYDAAGRFDATLAAEDLLVREDGVAQQVRGVFRVPADVLLVLDTGGEANPAKRVRLTREAAAAFVDALRPEDRLAVWQVGERVEELSGREAGRAGALKALRERLFPGRRSALAEGLRAALGHLQKTPAGNRHLVLVSDGLDPTGGGLALTESFRQLAAADVTVHVLSYTAIGRKAPGPPVTRKRGRGPLPHEGVEALPRTKRRENPAPDLRDINEAKGGTVIDLDRLFGGDRRPRAELERREAEFESLTDETGGTLALPATAEEMVAQAGAVAREVDSRYVVTYKPLRPVADAPAGEYRNLDVLARRLGLIVRARRGYLVKRSDE